MTTPNFFADLAKKCAKATYEHEIALDEEVAKFKGLLTKVWDDQKSSLAKLAVDNGDSSMTVLFGIGAMKFKAFRPGIRDLEKHLPDELAQAVKAKKGRVFTPNQSVLSMANRPVLAVEITYKDDMDAHLKQIRQTQEGPKRKREEAKPAEPAARQEPKQEPKIKRELA